MLVGTGARQVGACLIRLGLLLGGKLSLPLDWRSIGVSGLARPADLGSVGDGCAVGVDLCFDSASGLSAGLLPR